MPSKERENKVKLQCTECKSVENFTRKNKKTLKERLELKKYCKKCKKHTLHKETK
ncbi:MAG: 50S ribosomal protein L33 [bacterium]